MAETVTKTTREGKVQTFDISAQGCHKFGFYPGDRVTTPKGNATVVGTADGFLWVQIDGDSGASFWNNALNYEQLLALEPVGFSLIEAVYPRSKIASLGPVVEIDRSLITPSVENIASEKHGVYKLKKLTIGGKPTSIVLQNENGPCPLIAICNILLMRGLITLQGEGNGNLITVNNMMDSVSAYLFSAHSEKLDLANGEEWMKKIERSSELLPALQFGLDVNCTFRDIEGFERTDATLVFEMLNIRMVHGWLVDPADRAVADAVGSSSYNDLIIKVVSLDSTPSASSTPTPTSPSPSAPSPSPSSSSDAPTDPPVDPLQAHIIQEFLTRTSSQLTTYGILQLQHRLQEREMVLFFRNNHFSTLTKHNGALYTLVTDVGFERERNITWEQLDSVEGGGSIFHDADFSNTGAAKREEVVNTLLLMGFSLDKIETALKTVPPEVMNNADEAISRCIQNLGPVA